MQTTFRKCADSGKQDGQDGQAENVEVRDGGDREQLHVRDRGARGCEAEREREERGSSYCQHVISLQPAPVRCAPKGRCGRLLACSPLTRPLADGSNFFESLQSCAGS